LLFAYKGVNGVKAKFIGAPIVGSNKKAICMPKSLVTNLQGPKEVCVPKKKELIVGQLQSRWKILGA
jgi:hypothetical protein